MKKIIAIILLMYYLVGNFQLSINLHYCHNQLVNWSLFDEVGCNQHNSLDTQKTTIFQFAPLSDVYKAKSCCDKSKAVSEAENASCHKNVKQCNHCDSSELKVYFGDDYKLLSNYFVKIKSITVLIGNCFANFFSAFNSFLQGGGYFSLLPNPPPLSDFCFKAIKFFYLSFIQIFII